MFQVGDEVIRIDGYYQHTTSKEEFPPMREGDIDIVVNIRDNACFDLKKYGYGHDPHMF